jgi:DNA polymerase III sliding clamp (beta) subunit (PCNA family)
MINLHLEGLLLNEVSEIKDNGNTYTFTKKQINKDMFLVFNIKGTNKELKLNLNSISKVIDCVAYKIDDVIDDIEDFLNNIYNTYNIEFNLI